MTWKEQQRMAHVLGPLNPHGRRRRSFWLPVLDRSSSGHSSYSVNELVFGTSLSLCLSVTLTFKWNTLFVNKNDSSWSMDLIQSEEAFQWIWTFLERRKFYVWVAFPTLVWILWPVPWFLNLTDQLLQSGEPSSKIKLNCWTYTVYVFCFPGWNLTVTLPYNLSQAINR